MATDDASICAAEHAALNSAIAAAKRATQLAAVHATLDAAKQASEHTAKHATLDATHIPAVSGAINAA